MTSRGCGSREQRALYLCTTTSIFGLPLEHFLVDPPIEWKGESVRAPMLVEGSDGTKHILLGIGAKYYPTVPSFVEEAKVMGVSMRVPSDFDLSQIEHNKSKFLLMHPKAIPRFMYDIGEDLECPKTGCFCQKCQAMEDTHKQLLNKNECIGDLWPLASYVHQAEVHEIHELDPSDRAHIITPSVNFWVTVPKVPRHILTEHIRCPSCGFRGIENVKKDRMSCPKCHDEFHAKASSPKVTLNYASGIILMFPSFHFEYVTTKGKVPPDLRENFEGTPWRLDVCPE